MSASLITRAALLAGTAMLLTGCLSSDKSSPGFKSMSPLIGPNVKAGETVASSSGDAHEIQIPGSSGDSTPPAYSGPA